MRAWAAVMFFAGPAFAAEPSADKVLARATSEPGTAFSGTLTETRRYGQGTRSVMIRLDHAPGKYRREVYSADGVVTRLSVSDGKAGWVALPHKKLARRGAPRPEKSTGWDKAALTLLLKNYTATVAGKETVAGREAWVVRLAPHDPGKGRQEYWVDQKTGLILRSKRFDSDGEQTALSEFSTLDIPAKHAEDTFQYEPGADYKVQNEAAKALPLPSSSEGEGETLPGGFLPVGSSTVEYEDRKVEHRRFSDGLVSLSFFESPAKTKVTALKDAAFTRGAVVNWRADGRHFVLMGEVSEGLLKQVADALKARHKE